MLINLIGLFLFAIYIFLLGYMLEGVLIKVFHFERNWRTKILGVFGGSWLTSSVAGVAVTFGKFDNWTLFLILGVPLLIVLLLHRFIVSRSLVRGGETPLSVLPFRQAGSHLKGTRGLYTLLIILFLLLDVIGFYLLASSKTGLSISTPWQTILPYFIYIFAIATLVLGLLIYWTKSPWLLVLLVVHSFLLHSYLPLTHDLLYGADGWRHVASEANILDGNKVTPATVTDDRQVWSATFLIGKLAYSQLWGVSVVLAKVTGIGLIEINKWLLPVVWSLFVPILLFEIGKSLGWSTRRSLLLVWLSFLPYALQVGGSFTLPVNLGFISWLFLLLLMFKRADKPDRRQLFFLIGGGVLLFFGYTLFVILFWICWLMLEFFRWQKFTLLKGGLMVLGMALIFPVIEWVFGYSGIRPSGFLSGITQMIGNFTAYYLANGPRPHTIATGNVIFNQVPTYSFVVNAFTYFRWWLVAFMVVFLALAKYGWIKSVKFSQDLKTQWLVVFSAGLFLSYAISRYFLPGEHLLTRRFEVVLALFLIILANVGGEGFFAWLGRTTGRKTVGEPEIPRAALGMTVVILLVTVAIAASFSLGPDTGTVSVDEYNAMAYVNGQIGGSKPCVMAGTLPLLGLQAISKGKIVGGGFPIDHNFAQPELDTLAYNQKNTIADVLYDVKDAIKITGAGHCWVLVENQKVTDVNSTVFGSVTVMRVP